MAIWDIGIKLIKYFQKPLDGCIYMVYTICREVANMNATIQKWGNSQGIRIPKTILDGLSLKEGAAVELLVEGDALIIKPQSKKNIQELFAGYEGEYVPGEVNWGKDVGGEVW